MPNQYEDWYSEISTFVWKGVYQKISLSKVTSIRRYVPTDVKQAVVIPNYLPTFTPAGEFPGLAVVVLPKLSFAFLSAGFNIWKEHNASHNHYMQLKGVPQDFSSLVIDYTTLVIDYQKPNSSYTALELGNLHYTQCNRLHITGNQLPVACSSV